MGVGDGVGEWIDVEENTILLHMLHYNETIECFRKSWKQVAKENTK